MATDIVQSLFGITPDMYEQSQQAQAEARALQYAKLNPFEQANYAIGRGASMLGGAIGRGLGGEDPERRKIELQQQLLSGIDLSDPKSLIQGAKDANQMGLPQLSLNLVDRAKALQESAGKIAVQNAQLLKAMQPAKLTGDERYINALQTIEEIYQAGGEPTPTQKSIANMAGQMLSKPRSFLDPASGAMITQAATDPSQAFPLTYKAMRGSSEGGATTVPKPTVQQATTGNLPAASQKEIADIEADLVKLKDARPQLDSFTNSLKSGDVKFNAAANAFDFLGAVIPPIFGGQEVGNQVKKDEFTRAFTERVNFVLNNAKGVQARDDAKRAEQQIASPSTFYSSARMQGAIDYLKKAEGGYEKELEARKNSLQRQGKPEAQETPSAKPVEAKPTETRPITTPKSGGTSRDQLIDSVVQFNASKGKTITRSQAEKALRDAGKL